MPLAASPRTPLYLKHLIIQRYVRLEQVHVGPFAPGLNIVQGPGEGGKQVISSFIAGALFGWPAAQRMAGAGAPALQGEGRLVFADAAGGELILEAGGLPAREGLDEGSKEGSDALAAAALTEGVDAATYCRSFRLRSEALSQLAQVMQVKPLLRAAAPEVEELPQALLDRLEAQIAAQLSACAAGEPLGFSTSPNPLVAEASNAPASEATSQPAAAKLASWKGTREGCLHLAGLLIARQAAQAALASWRRGRGAQIDRRAGIILEDMTDGAWLQLRRDADGVPFALDAAGEAHDAQLLSLALRQQMHSALQLAVLMANPSLGTSLPVLVDDIVAAAEPEARPSLARALAQLARTRQVVAFCKDASLASLLGDLHVPVNMVRL